MTSYRIHVGFLAVNASGSEERRQGNLACGGVRSPGGCGGVRGRVGQRVARGAVSCGTPEIQVQTAPGDGLRGFKRRGGKRLSAPFCPFRGKVNSAGQSQLKSLTRGPKSTGVRFPRQLSNESNPQLSKACQPCQPCTSAAHSRAAAASAAALPHARTLSLTQRCRLASIPSRAGLASHHTRRLRHSTLSSSPPSTLVFGREISDSLLDFNTTSTTKVCASSQRHATWPTGPRPLPLSHDLDRPSPLAPCSSPISIFPTPSPHSSLLAPSPSALAGFPCSLVYISPNLASKCGGEGVTA